MSEPIIVEQLLLCAPAVAWKAITDKTEMKQWYFDLEAFDPTPGFEFQFYGGPSPDRQYLHLCEITEVLPGRRLSYSWRYDGYPGNSLVSFELFPEANQTVLKLTHSGVESFDQANVDFAKTNFVEGWNQIIRNSLPTYIASKS